MDDIATVYKAYLF